MRAGILLLTAYGFMALAVFVAVSWLGSKFAGWVMIKVGMGETSLAGRLMALFVMALGLAMIVKGVFTIAGLVSRFV